MPSKLLISRSSVPAIIFLVYDYVLSRNSGEYLNLKGVAVTALCVFFVFISIRNRKIYLKANKYVVSLLVISLVSNLIYICHHGINGIQYILIKLMIMLSLYIYAVNINVAQFIVFFKTIFLLVLFLSPFYILFGQGPPIYAALPYLILSRHKACFWIYILILSCVSYYYLDRGLLLILFMFAAIRMAEVDLKLKERYIKYTILTILLIVIVTQFIIGLNYSHNSFANIILTKRPYIWGIYLDAIINADYLKQIFGNGRIDNNFATNVGELVAYKFGNGRPYTSHSIYINTLYEYGILGFMLIIGPLIKLMMNHEFKQCESSYIISMLLILGFVTPISLFGITGISIMFSLIVVYSLKNFTGN